MLNNIIYLIRKVFKLQQACNNCYTTCWRFIDHDALIRTLIWMWRKYSLGSWLKKKKRYFAWYILHTLLDSLRLQLQSSLQPELSRPLVDRWWQCPGSLRRFPSSLPSSPRSPPSSWCHRRWSPGCPWCSSSWPLLGWLLSALWEGSSAFGRSLLTTHSRLELSSWPSSLGASLTSPLRSLHCSSRLASNGHHYIYIYIYIYIYHFYKHISFLQANSLGPNKSII